MDTAGLLACYRLSTAFVFVIIVTNAVHVRVMHMCMCRLCGMLEQQAVDVDVSMQGYLQTVSRGQCRSGCVFIY